MERRTAVPTAVADVRHARAVAWAATPSGPGPEGGSGRLAGAFDRPLDVLRAGFAGALVVEVRRRVELEPGDFEAMA